MALNTFFLSEQVLSKEAEPVFALRLDEDDAHHLKVLRLGAGEHIAVVDASSDYFECEIASHSDGKVLVRISSHPARDGAGDREGMPSVVLFQGMPKGDRFETAVRQGTEIGVDGFVPFLSERSISRPDGSKGERKAARWRAIAKSAAMQSGRLRIPDVCAPVSFDDALAALGGFDRVIVFWEGCPATGTLSEALAGLPSPRARVAVVVGPEGGFSESEVHAMVAASRDARICTLGETILRTETAAVVGCALVLFELGGLGGESSDPAASSAKAGVQP